MEKQCAHHVKKHSEFLKQSGLKLTQSRLKLLDILEHAKKPLSIKEIYSLLKLKNTDLVTVYRNVEILKQLGFVSEVLLGQAETFYELSSQKHHHHAVCEVCGRVEDVPEIHHGKIDELAKKASGFGVISRHSLEFFGICKNCNLKK